MSLSGYKFEELNLDNISNSKKYNNSNDNYC